MLAMQTSWQATFLFFCCTRQRQRCAYHCTARRLPAHEAGANLLCPCPKSGSGQHSHRHAGYCTVLVPVPDNTATDTLGTAPSLFHR